MTRVAWQPQSSQKTLEVIPRRRFFQAGNRASPQYFFCSRQMLYHFGGSRNTFKVRHPVIAIPRNQFCQNGAASPSPRAGGVRWCNRIFSLPNSSSKVTTSTFLHALRKISKLRRCASSIGVIPAITTHFVASGREPRSSGCVWWNNQLL